MAQGRAEIITQLESEGLFVTEWSDPAGTTYPRHSHGRLEVRVVLEGQLTLWLSDGKHELGPGDRIDIEAGTEHEAAVGPDGVTYLAGSGR